MFDLGINWQIQHFQAIVWRQNQRG